MKTLAGYDEENKPDYRKKVNDDLEKIEARALALNDGLNASKPDLDKLSPDYVWCKSSLLRIQKLVTDSESDDLIERYLYLNDLLNGVISGYEELKSGKVRTTPIEKPTKPISLIDFDHEEESKEPVGNLMDDLAGLSFGEATTLPFGQGGSITLDIPGKSPIMQPPFAGKPSSPASSVNPSAVPKSPAVSMTPTVAKLTSPALSKPDSVNGQKQVTMFEKNGLKITVKLLSREKNTSKYCFCITNALPLPLDNFAMQVAVPRSMTIGLDVLSSTTIAKDVVTQTFKITKTNDVCIF